MNFIERFHRWAQRRADMAELTAYCLARSYASKCRDWYLWDACQSAINRKARQIAIDELKPLMKPKKP